MQLLPPRPVGTVPAAPTAFSLFAHAALVAATVRAGGPAAAAVDAAPNRGAVSGALVGERLRWVGLGDGPGVAVRRARPGERPPSAYVVPGRDGLRALVGGDLTAGEGGARNRASGSGGGGDRDEPLPPGPSIVRRAARRAPRPLPGLPNVTLPDASATLLAAGVLSAAPDLARRVSRAEDFVPSAELVAGLLAVTGVTASRGLGSSLHLHDLPIPLVNNPPPAYPAALARAGVGGQVVVEFLIDSTGSVDAGTLRVVESTDARFTDAVRGVLPRLRFVPAQLGERAVGVTVRQPFRFTMRGGA